MGSLTTEVLKNGGRIQTLNTAFLFTSTPVDGTPFAAQIKCYSQTLDRFKARKYGEEIMRDRKNEASAETMI